jgi:dimeric dUTPase (all-alpha-NTP-PPase superfamily)
MNDSSIWPAIFEHQRELELKFAPVEQANGFFVAALDLIAFDEPQVQEYIRIMFWRVTEEFAESTANYPHYEPEDEWKDKYDSDVTVRNFFEEVIDALHFFVAASLHLGISPSLVSNQWDAIAFEPYRTRIMPVEQQVQLQMFKVVKQMGLVANLLKNKPWKRTHHVTDPRQLRDQMMWAWLEFGFLLKMLRCTAEDIYNFYLAKNKVNHARVEGTY